MCVVEVFELQSACMSGVGSPVWPVRCPVPNSGSSMVWSDSRVFRPLGRNSASTSDWRVRVGVKYGLNYARLRFHSKR